jgi:hypothetical protein
VPNIRNEDLLASSGENFFDRPNQPPCDALPAGTVVNNEFAQIGPEPQIVSAKAVHLGKHEREQHAQLK